MKNKLTSAMSQQTDKGVENSIAFAQLGSHNSEAATAEVTNIKKDIGMPAHSVFRFINFAIDMLIWFVLALISIVLLDFSLPTVDHFTINALAYCVMTGLFCGYYFILEYFFQKTLGKLLTGTKVVGLNGEKPNAKAVFLRTLSRLIPIDMLFYFFSRTGLHDSLSSTKVVKSKKG